MSLRLAFFDVDGTLKQERDPYMYLHKHLGTEAAGRALIDSFLAARVDYETFCQQDTALWTGQPVAAIDALFAAVPYVPAARELAAALGSAGVPIVLVSTGIDRSVRQVAADVGAAAWHANELVVADGRLTGQMYVHVRWDAKGDVVRRVMAERGVGPDECLAVGDGSGDLPMFAEVKHRVAVAPSADVRGAVDFVLEEGDVLAWLAQRGCNESLTGGRLG